MLRGMAFMINPLATFVAGVPPSSALRPNEPLLLSRTLFIYSKLAASACQRM